MRQPSPGEIESRLRDNYALDIDSAVPGLAERLQRIRVDTSNLDFDR
jgi:hypothetical protein